MRATLFVDESGTFGDHAHDPERELRVVAGLWLPDGTEHELYRVAIAASGSDRPLHAGKMEPRVRDRVLGAVQAALPTTARVFAMLDGGAGGYTRYGEVLGALVRHVFGQVHLLGERGSIRWVSAKRKQTFSGPELARCIADSCAGLSEGGGTITCDGLDLEVAEACRGLQLADLVVNLVWREARQQRLPSIVPADRLHVGWTIASEPLELLYGQLRATVPSLIDSAEAVVCLARERPEGEARWAAARGSESVGRHLLTQIVAAVGRGGSHTKVAHRLHHETRWRLDAKAGDYEAVALAYEAWLGGTSDTGFADDADLMFEVCLAQAELANHRGEVNPAWFDSAWAQLSRTRSVQTLSRRFHLSNLEMVCQQNQLLVDNDAAMRLRQAGERARRSLDAYGQVADLLAGGLDEPTPLERRPDPVLVAGGRRPAPLFRPDHVRGALLGTLGRTLGFLGEPEDSISALLDAREAFDTDFDLALNASSLAHAALQARLDGVCGGRAEAVLRAVLEHHLPERRPEHHDLAGGRFRLRLLLKVAEVWPDGLDDFPASAWEDELSGRLLDEAHRSEGHPIELVARHAALWLRHFGSPSRVVAAWWEVATRPWATGDLPAIVALKKHSARLRDGVAPSGPRGSATNPVFEYR